MSRALRHPTLPSCLAAAPGSLAQPIVERVKSLLLQWEDFEMVSLDSGEQITQIEFEL